MRYHHLLLPLLSLSPLATTQQLSSHPTNTSTEDPTHQFLSASYLNLTFSPRTNPICTHNSTSPQPALSIAIRSLPQTSVCFSLADTFSHPATTYNAHTTGHCDAKLGLCGVEYTVFGTGSGEREMQIEERGWDSVFYSQVRDPWDGGIGTGAAGRLEVEVFSGDRCRSGGDGGRARWNCVDPEGSCRGLGFGVRSFRVELMEAEDVGMDCVVAATGGVGRREIGWGGVGVGVLGLVVGWWL